MARRIAVQNLNGSTLDIINTIRANATQEYQSLVPQIDDISQLRSVGDVLFGYPALANQFLSSLINRIAREHHQCPGTPAETDDFHFSLRQGNRQIFRV